VSIVAGKVEKVADIGMDKVGREGGAAREGNKGSKRPCLLWSLCRALMAVAWQLGKWQGLTEAFASPWSSRAELFQSPSVANSSIPGPPSPRWMSSSASGWATPCCLRPCWTRCVDWGGIVQCRLGWADERNSASAYEANPEHWPSQTKP
jgi:hypothetical protein